LETPGLEPALVAFRDGVRAALGEQLLGIYISGSLVMGDFEPASSDVDFLVVTRGPLDAGPIERLAALHTRLPEPWGGRLEGEYSPLAQLSASGVVGACPSVSPVSGFRSAVSGQVTAENVAAMRERSITLFGPHPRELLPAVNAGELRAAFRADLAELADELVEVDATGASRAVEALASAALNVARCLYGLRTGHISTKREGAVWLAQEEPALDVGLGAALAVRRGVRDAVTAGSLYAALPELRRHAVTGARLG
jgi:hypothetical protein